jgi:hypothetical protein
MAQNDNNVLSKMNREIGETLVMVGSIKDMLDSHKEVHNDIRELLEKHDERITSIEETRTWARSAMWLIGLIGSAVGTIIGLITSALAK